MAIKRWEKGESAETFRNQIAANLGPDAMLESSLQDTFEFAEYDDVDLTVPAGTMNSLFTANGFTDVSP